MLVKTAGGVFSPQPAAHEVIPNNTGVEFWTMINGLPMSPCAQERKTKKQNDKSSHCNIDRL